MILLPRSLVQFWASSARSWLVEAKSAASLDVLAPGRVQLGLGTGAFWDAIAAMGGPRREAKEAAAALDEAIEIIRLMWSGERSVRFRGEHYSISGVHPGPTPSSDLGVWLGAYGPRMLALTGRKADGWMPSYGFLGLDRLKDAVARIDAGAHEAGRDPASLRKIYNLNGLIGSVESAVPFQGTTRQWADQLVALVRDYDERLRLLARCRPSAPDHGVRAGGRTGGARRAGAGTLTRRCRLDTPPARSALRPGMWVWRLAVLMPSSFVSWCWSARCWGACC
ncbi:LLM class flavin-dependent oxidoreductase [Streptomyces sp. NPDC059474]|uniref:LLM class flavin-dependent oxidoreductase n=1 Tax=Streptomyces sp. NPDC059474 TaxID=3346846 RepID=UPI0036A4E3B9